MVRQRFNKYQRKENREKRLAQNMHGEGLYVFENANSVADLTLPRPTSAGVRKVGPKGRFQGDDYYFGMVRSNELRLIETLMTPEAQRNNNNMEQKLILDQPNIVKQEGTIEHVLPVKQKPLHEGIPNEEKPDVLINEDPMSGVEIILE